MKTRSYNKGDQKTVKLCTQVVMPKTKVFAHMFSCQAKVFAHML